jgi:serine/threonine protein kinase
LEEEEDLSEEEDSTQATTRSPKRRLKSSSCPRLKRHKAKPKQDEVMVKIIDFGFAVQYNRGEYVRCVTGSPAYASPEILFGNKHDPAVADIWSLGVCLYRMVMGKFPFCDPDKDDISKLKTNLRDYSRRSTLFPTTNDPSTPEVLISEELKDLLCGMLNFTDRTRLSFDQIAQHPWVNRW